MPWWRAPVGFTTRWVPRLQASVTCSVTGHLTIPDLGRISNKEGEEVFSERKNLFNILQNKVRVRQRVPPGSHRAHVLALPMSAFTSSSNEPSVWTRPQDGISRPCCDPD